MSVRSRPALAWMAWGLLAIALAAGCRDALDGDACLAACERRITCGLLAEFDRASCERACVAGGACDPGAAETCAYCLVEADCDEAEEACEDACADPCAVGAGGSGGDGGAGGDGGGGRPPV